ncbi:MAG: 30S ribosomal protein S13 [Candidatus Thermoplasmatota archaeon]|nr:30S ribosomal protein S13 [Candidatus Thermoplasmatota archaeon]
MEEKKPEFKYIVRIADTDLDGNRSVVYGLTKIKGIGIRCSEAIADAAQLPRYKKLGELSDEEIEKLRDCVENIPKYLPGWLLNRMHELYSGSDSHLIGSELELGVKEDIGLMKKIRCYKGIRHERGQRVRGQRTRSHGRTGLTVGVVRKVAVEARKKAEEEERKKAREKK